MLTPDEVSKRLAASTIPNWISKRVAALDAFPPSLAKLARDFVEDKHESGFGQNFAAKKQAFAAEVAALTPAARLGFFTSLFPKLAPVMDRTWCDLAEGTYTTSYARKPFRAPDHPNFYLKTRADWLARIIDALRGQDPDAAWLAAWGPRVNESYLQSYLGPTLASAINLGGEQAETVLEVLKQSASGTHEVGRMGHHVPRALLACSRPDAWDFMERMLLSAQREEGLRQAILETVNESRPEVFIRFLRLILDNKLTRFSATVRAADVWFGLMYSVLSAKEVEATIRTILSFFDDPQARRTALIDGDGDSAYFALWVEAFLDVTVALRLADTALQSTTEERRYAAAKILGHFQTQDALPLLSRAIEDADVRVAARTMDSLAALVSYEYSESPVAVPPETFDRLLALMDRIKGKSTKFKPLVFPWERSLLQASEIGPLTVRCLPKENVSRVLPFLDRFGASERASLAFKLVHLDEDIHYRSWERPKKVKSIDPAFRPAIVQLLGDPASSVREVASSILESFTLKPDEAVKHEELLERSASDIRARALARLQGLNDAELLSSCERLLKGGTPARSGALELLRVMAASNRSPDAARALAQSFSESAPKLSADDHRKITLVLQSGHNKPEDSWTLENALGLLDNEKRGRLTPPAKHPRFTFDAAAAKVLLDLDKIVEANKERELKPVQNYVSETPLLGGDSLWGAPQVHDSKTPEERKAKCPVRDLLDSWWNAQRTPPAATSEAILRAWVWLTWAGSSTLTRRDADVKLPEKHGTLRFYSGTDYLLDWLMVLHGPSDSASLLLNWAESVIADTEVDPNAAKLPASTGSSLAESLKAAWGKIKTWGDSGNKTSSELTPQSVETWISLARNLSTSPLATVQPEDHARLWSLLRWLESYGLFIQKARAYLAKTESSSRGYEENRQLDAILSLSPTLEETLRAWDAGAATEHDFYAAALPHQVRSTYSHSFSSLETIGRPGAQGRTIWPQGADAAYEALRARVIQIEIGRGDAPTPASGPALALRPSGGLEVVVSVLARIGKERLFRGYLYGGKHGRAEVFSTLLRNAVPREGETPERFAHAARTEKLPEDRLIDLALYAPQWAEHVEVALGWKSLAEGVWWIHAHTKDDRWSIDKHIRDGWDARIAERTPVPKDELANGAVDPAWFFRVYETLGPDRWNSLYDAAKYASGSGGHKRAQLFADAMLGRTSEKELLERINTKRHQEAIRAICLCPVKWGKAGTSQVLARYKVLQEFRRSSAKHGGSMLQASEKRAVEIGMQNLARIAGYADPVRLQWAMETEAVADLSDGPVSVTVGECTVSLSVDSEGVPSIATEKKGKSLKSVPADIKKHEEVKALTDRLAELRRQGSRMRLSLELAMCRGDEFSSDELAALWRHPILRPMLSRLVFITSGMLGYPQDGANSLLDHRGESHPLNHEATLRIAHPHDLLASKQWHEWQSECLRSERIQPFKQIFRELYLPTSTEKGDTLETTRYRGHQVQPRQALALFGSRGWVARPEEGIHRTFHHERITAFVTFEEYFYTPADVECLTLRGLSFVPVGKWQPLRIEDVPPRLLSEVLRDMDLVVSVAHAGGVDPEASQSSVEMRAALLRETARVLKLDNITVDTTRAFIKGKLAEYALHLGSANVQMLPGGSVFIVAVQSHHRGRIFLPFADEDPKTAEVLSKALLLARDNEIRDPAILDQIHR